MAKLDSRTTVVCLLCDISQLRISVAYNNENSAAIFPARNIAVTIELRQNYFQKTA